VQSRILGNCAQRSHTDILHQDWPTCVLLREARSQIFVVYISVSGC